MGFHAIFVYFTKPAVEVLSFFVIIWVSKRFLALGPLPVVESRPFIRSITKAVRLNEVKLLHTD